MTTMKKAKKKYNQLNMIIGERNYQKRKCRKKRRLRRMGISLRKAIRKMIARKTYSRGNQRKQRASRESRENLLIQMNPNSQVMRTKTTMIQGKVQRSGKQIKIKMEN
jgi:hypothetical protein